MDEIHPVIRIVSFVILTVFLALGAVGNILVGAAVMALLYITLDKLAWQTAGRMLRRMRWLFLSIAVIYFWLTPGTPLFNGGAALDPWLPTAEGIWQGGLRITSLALMVMAACILLQVTPRDQMLAALHWLLKPLGMLGVSHERFAVRTALTLEAVKQVQGHVRDVLATIPATTKPVARIGAVAAMTLNIVIQEAEVSSCGMIEMPALRSPALPQWGMPLLLFAVMTTIRQLTL
jgi:energy-coupling factor transporter transmembrane protein EcfT